MRHATCRQAVVAEKVTSPVEVHLRACPACATFAADLRVVLEAASGLDPGLAPPGLADRALAGAWGAPATSLPGPDGALVPLGSARASRRARPFLAAGSAAAALLVLVAALAVLPGRRGTGQGGRGDADEADLPALLLASAERTATLDTYRLRVEAEARSDLALPQAWRNRVEVTVPSLPDLPSFEGLPEGRVEVEERLRRAREQFQEQLENHLRTSGVGSHPFFDLPERISFDVSFAGTGEVVQPDRLHLTGIARVSGSAPFAASLPGEVELVVVGRDAYLRQADGTWVRLPGAPGSFGPVLLDADAALAALRHPEGGIEDLGVETLDGERVRHVRFGVDGDRLGRAGVRFRSEVWVGTDDDLLRKLTLSTQGSLGPDEAATARAGLAGLSLDWSASTTLRLSDFGADVTVEPPPPAQVRDGEAASGLSVLVYPFHFSFSSG